ncbi:CxxC-x17-CxxC domain-containing protein [Chloroflexota bacterium]
MSYVDKELPCLDCDSTFTFSAEEQELFATRGYTNEPKRCSLCRASRKARSGNFSGFTTGRQMYPTVCADCGKDTQVPFEPRNGRPVYCSDCYAKVRR